MALADDLQLAVLRYLSGLGMLDEVLDWLTSHVQAIHDASRDLEAQADLVWMAIDEFNDDVIDEPTLRTELARVAGLPGGLHPAEAQRVDMRFAMVGLQVLPRQHAEIQLNGITDTRVSHAELVPA